MSNLKDQNRLPSLQHWFDTILEVSLSEHERLSVALHFFCPLVSFYLRKQFMLRRVVSAHYACTLREKNGTLNSWWGFN